MLKGTRLLTRGGSALERGDVTADETAKALELPRQVTGAEVGAKASHVENTAVG